MSPTEMAELAERYAATEPPPTPEQALRLAALLPPVERQPERAREAVRS